MCMQQPYMTCLLDYLAWPSFCVVHVCIFCFIYSLWRCCLEPTCRLHCSKQHCCWPHSCTMLLGSWLPVQLCCAYVCRFCGLYILFHILWPVCSVYSVARGCSVLNHILMMVMYLHATCNDSARLDWILLEKVSQFSFYEVYNTQRR